MSFLVVTPSELTFNINNTAKFKVYMIYNDQYIELGNNTNIGIGVTNPLYPIHTKNVFLKNIENITYNSGFKIQVNNSPLSFIPIGTIVIWPLPLNVFVTNPMDLELNTYLPHGWLPCNGQSLSKLDYPNLFTILQYDYGGSDNFFNLPNFRGDVDGAFAVCNRTSTAIAPTNSSYKTKRNTSDVNGRSIKALRLQSNNIPSHYHLFTGTGSANGFQNHTHDFYYQHTGGDGESRAGPFETTGDGNYWWTTNTAYPSHNHTYSISMDSPGTTSINMEQQYMVMNYIIRVY
jgi:microcystin-dependent protein